MWKFFPAEVTPSRFLFIHEVIAKQQEQIKLLNNVEIKKKKVKNTLVSQQLCSMEQMLKMLWPLGLDRLPKRLYPDAWNVPYCIF